MFVKYPVRHIHTNIVVSVESCKVPSFCKIGDQINETIIKLRLNGIYYYCLFQKCATDSIQCSLHSQLVSVIFIFFSNVYLYMCFSFSYSLPFLLYFFSILFTLESILLFECLFSLHGVNTTRLATFGEVRENYLHFEISRNKS